MPAHPEGPGRVLIGEVLSSLNITRILFIDDRFDDPATGLEDVLGQIADVRPGLFGLADQYPALLETADGDLEEDELRSSLRRVWPGLPAAAQAAVRGLLVQETTVARPDTQELIDDAAASLDLKPALPDGIDLVSISVTAWRADRVVYFPEGYPPTIVLFDRDLDQYGGRTGGDELVVELLKDHRANVFTGMFTHEATDLGQEIKIANELAELGAGAVAVMGKNRVQDPSKLAEGLRLFVYTSDLDLLRSDLVNAIEASAKAATSRLHGIGFEALMASVEAARDEGQLEQDGPLRIATRKMRRELERQIRARADQDHAVRLRKAAAQKIGDSVGQSDEMAHLRWEDRFDDGEHLAGAHLPLDAGDIFEVQRPGGESQYFILLMQACDLMIRPSGRRTNAPTAFTLAQLKPRPDTKELGTKYFEVGQLDPTDATCWVADFTRRITIATQLLDQCVLTEDGTATFFPQLIVPVGLTEGWRVHAQELEKWRVNRLREIAKRHALLPGRFTGSARAEVEAQLAAPLLGAGCADGTVSALVDPSFGTITVGIRRHAHLVMDHSRAMLILASQYHARPDRDGDLFHELAAII